MPIIGKEITPSAKVAALLTSMRDTGITQSEELAALLASMRGNREVENTVIKPEMDIVEKLKEQAAEIADNDCNVCANTMLEAADNIEQLREVVKLQHDMTTELSNFAFK